MKKLPNSNFALLQDIFKELNIEYNEKAVDNSEKLSEYWGETVGEKISKFSKVLKLTSDNTLIIVCSDSYAANELYYVKAKLIEEMNEKVKNLGIEIQDIKFDYKKWKEQEYDK